MAKPAKNAFLEELRSRFPTLRRVSASQSLFDVPETSQRFYIRYSKTHGANRTFFGLRRTDLRWLEGHKAIICFVWDEQTEPLLVPYAAFEDVFASAEPAQDGQYKVQVFPDSSSTELYLAGIGRFNVDAYVGWRELEVSSDKAMQAAASTLTHSQVQTLLGSIGFAKGNDVWLPQADRAGLDWKVTAQFPVCPTLPGRFDAIRDILAEIDVIWVRRGSGNLVALYEVEHTTSIYSGLLRFNDVHLYVSDARPRYSIVANDARRSVFAKQLRRQTFQQSGLSEVCTFMQYENVLDWHRRTTGDQR